MCCWAHHRWSQTMSCVGRYKCSHTAHHSAPSSVCPLDQACNSECQQRCDCQPMHVTHLASLSPADCASTGAVDRTKLAEIVLGNTCADDHEDSLARLEAAVHPLVDAARASFLQKVRPSATGQH
jgi:hypothetical protein